MNFNEGIARFYDKFLGDRGKEKEKELHGISFCSHECDISLVLAQAQHASTSFLIKI